MTADEFIRFVLFPALGAAALFAIIVTVREEWKAFRRGEW